MIFCRLEKVFCKKYKLKFVGEEKDLSDYIVLVMSDELVFFNFITKQWEIKACDVNKFINCHKDIEIPINRNTLKIVKYDKELENIGHSLKLKPYAYQKEAVKFILDNGKVLLVLPCGSGKTAVGIASYVESVEQGLINSKGLIVVKASLKTQWVNEVSKFSNLRATIIETPSSISTYNKSKINKNNKKIKSLDKIKNKELIQKIKIENTELENKIMDKFKEQFKDMDLFVVNYEALLDNTIRQELHKQKIDFIFADEIHMVADSDAKRSKALQEFQAKIKVGATATPIPKNPENIYSIFKFINPELFPSLSKFRKDFVMYKGRGKPSGTRNKEKLKKTYAPFTMIKTKEEISDQLPKLQVIQRYVKLTNEQYEMCDVISQELDGLKEQEFSLRNKCKTDEELKTNVNLLKIQSLILSLQTFAQELVDDPRLLDISDSEVAKRYSIKKKDSPKLELFMSLVEEIIESGEKVAVFSKYERMQQLMTDRIHKYNKAIKVAYVNGKMSSSERSIEVYDKFRDNDEYKVLILSNAGNEGFNLSKCKYLIEYELADSYAIQTQRHGRLERADSIHDNVIVYQLIALDSWDEIQVRVVAKKENYDLELIKSLKE
jgi:SNF2 family DNA or RNA helicase